MSELRTHEEVLAGQMQDPAFRAARRLIFECEYCGDDWATEHEARTCPCGSDNYCGGY